MTVSIHIRHSVPDEGPRTILLHAPDLETTRELLSLLRDSPRVQACAVYEIGEARFVLPHVQEQARVIRAKAEYVDAEYVDVPASEVTNEAAEAILDRYLGPAVPLGQRVDVKV